MLEKLKKFKWGYILIALVLAAIGVCFIAFQEALKALAITIGVLLCIFAITFAVLTIAGKKRGAGFAFRIFFSVMALIAGIVTAVFNEGTVDIMISVFALLIIIDSSFKLHTSAMSKRYSVVGWWIIMAFAAISIAVAFYLIKFQPESLSACSIILGINLIINAINNILSAFYITSFETNMEDEISLKLRLEERRAREELADDGESAEGEPAEDEEKSESEE